MGWHTFAEAISKTYTEANKLFENILDAIGGNHASGNKNNGVVMKDYLIAQERNPKCTQRINTYQWDQLYMTIERIEKAVDELLSYPWLDSRHKRVLQEWAMFLEFTSAKLDALAEKSEVSDDAQFPVKYHQDCKIRSRGSGKSQSTKH